MSQLVTDIITTDRPVANSEKRLSICLRSNGFSFSEVTLSGVLLTFGEAEGQHATSMTSIMADVKALFASVGIRPLEFFEAMNCAHHYQGEKSKSCKHQQSKI